MKTIAIERNPSPYAFSRSFLGLLKSKRQKGPSPFAPILSSTSKNPRIKHLRQARCAVEEPRGGSGRRCAAHRGSRACMEEDGALRPFAARAAPLVATVVPSLTASISPGGIGLTFAQIKDLAGCRRGPHPRSARDFSDSSLWVANRAVPAGGNDVGEGPAADRSRNCQRPELRGSAITMAS